MSIVTITGIRPDFIRMSEVFEQLDAEFEHVMIHTGQHYDDGVLDAPQHDIRQADDRQARSREGSLIEFECEGAQETG